MELVESIMELDLTLKLKETVNVTLIVNLTLKPLMMKKKLKILIMNKLKMSLMSMMSSKISLKIFLKTFKMN